MPTIEESLDVTPIASKLVGSERALTEVESAESVLAKLEIDDAADCMFCCCCCSWFIGCASMDTRLLTRVLVSMPPNPRAARLMEVVTWRSFSRAVASCRLVVFVVGSRRRFRC